MNSAKNSDSAMARKFTDLVQQENRTENENDWLESYFDIVDEAELCGAIREWRDTAVAVYLAQRAKLERARKKSTPPENS
jgi:hypothetical protein